MKNIREIDALLERYWEGETTLEEERALKAYFASGEVNERHRSVAPLFRALREEQSLQLAARIIPVAPLRVQRFSWHGWAAAASVALLLTAGLWWALRETPVQQRVAQQMTVEQPQNAAQENPAQTQMNEEDKTGLVAETKPLASTEKKTVRPKKHIAAPARVPSADKPDPEAEQAMQEIKAALALVSSKLNKGKREAAKGAVQLENVDKIFIENVDRVFKIKSEG